MGVIHWQALIILSIALTSFFKKDALLTVCGFWTVFSLERLFHPPLLLFQLAVIWISYAIFSGEVRGRDGSGDAS